MKLRALLDDINMTTSRLGPQIDNMQQSLEGTKAHWHTTFSRTAVGPLTLILPQDPRDLRSWNGYLISRTQATTNLSARGA